MSCGKEHPLDNTGSFKLMYSARIEDTIPFYMYRSVNTGITVCIAEVNGPIIHGDFNIVTETFDDDGYPYALKHLIFMGSDDYPYNGILKLWAERSLGSNIDSFNLQNRTVFTMSAAGSKGFLTLMPIYLDHILYPKLKETAYLTEVYHITCKGNITGVVYRKIRKEERTSQYIIEKEMLQALYPGKCGYKSVIQGTTNNLRNRTNNKGVKQFHKKFYRSENLTILITGKIPHYKVFQALLPLEQKIMSKKREDIFEKPWQTPIEQLTKSVDVNVTFPISDKTHGKIYVAWRGPSAITQVYDYHGCLLLLDYFIATSSSPLTKAFVKNSDPSLITWFSTEWSDPYLKIIFKDVPVGEIDLITNKSIHKVLSNVCTDGINMETMKTIIHKFILDYQIDLEENPHKTIAFFLFDHLVYEETDKLKKRLNMLLRFEKLKNKPDTYFLNLLKNYFVDAPMVVVKGIPSLNAQSKLLQEEKIHITNHSQKLRQQKLKQRIRKRLNQAFKETNKLVPEDVLAKVAVPSIDSITSHHIERYNTETDKQHPKLDVKNMPIFTYLDHVITDFVYLQFVMDTSSISTQHRSYIPLVLGTFIESPVKRDDQLISSEELKASLFDIINVQSFLGINSEQAISDNVSLLLQVKLHNYEKSVQWSKKFLYDTKPTAESLKKSITRLLNDIDEFKVQGEPLVEILIDTLLYTNNDHRFTYNLLRQQKFLSEVQKRLNTDVGQKEVIANIESVRQTLTSPKNMSVHMAVNVHKLTQEVPDVYAPWNKYFSDFINSEKAKMNITSNSKLLGPSNSRLFYNGCIIGLERIKFSFFLQICPCISDFRHNDLPALEVCLTYFMQEGGPMWKNIREKALSADFNFYTTVDDGLLSLKFTSARNVVDAYQITKWIVEMHLDKTKWNQYLYEKAKSSTMLNYINNVNSIRSMIKTSLMCYYRNVRYKYINSMIQRIFVVTMADMSRAVAKYIRPLFDPNTCKIAIVCKKSEIDQIAKAFLIMRSSLKVYKSLEELSDYIEKMTAK